jgi:hypothetical protein
MAGLWKGILHIFLFFQNQKPLSTPFCLKHKGAIKRPLFGGAPVKEEAEQAKFMGDGSQEREGYTIHPKFSS